MSAIVQKNTYNNGLIYTNSEHCIDCNKCLHKCPAFKSNVSVSNENGSYSMCVDEKECISCGSCIDKCVHDARPYNDNCDDFFAALAGGKVISVIVSPAFYLNYPREYKNILGYLKSLGVKDFYCASIGEDISTWGYIKQICEEPKKCYISQQCPTVVSYIQKHHPSLLKNLITIHSPLMSTAIYLKRYLGIDDQLAYLSPCIAKKTEIDSKRASGLVKHNVTFNKLMEYIKRQGILLNDYPKVDVQTDFENGALFPSPGGLSDNIDFFLDKKAAAMKISGPHITYDFLKHFDKHNNSGEIELPAYVDITNCDRGCCYGTGSQFRNYDDYAITYHAAQLRKKKSLELACFTSNLPQNPAIRFEYLEERFRNLNLNDFKCDYETDTFTAPTEISEEEISKILQNSLHKLSKADQHIDCSACGYKSCRDMAKAIALGINHHENCLYYAKLNQKNLLLQLEASIEKEQAANSAKTKYLSNMSHEIRTPMSSVLGIAEIQLHKDNHSPEIEEAFTRIYNSSSLLLKIINDILDLSKVEAGKLEVTPALYDTASMIVDTVQLNLMNIGSKKIDFEIKVEETLPFSLIGDEIRVMQILNNLISNAIKYTKEGYVRLSFASQQSENDEEIDLIFTVSDSGQGMTQKQIDTLFGDEFTRFNLKTNRSIEGSGLGLTIAYHLTSLMGGDLSVESIPGNGSVFSVRLPQKKGGCDILGAVTAAKLQRLDDTQKTLKKISKLDRKPMPYGRVLVVDDVESNLYVAKGFLSPYKLSIDTAKSGTEAISKIESGEEYDVIFMDHMMPEIDGVETTKRIRKLGYSRPIVALTAHALSDSIELFMENDFSGFISKPIDIKKLDKYLNLFVCDKNKAEPDEKNYIETVIANEEKHSFSALPQMLIDSFLKDAKTSTNILKTISKKKTLTEKDFRLYTVNAHAMKSALYNIGKHDLSKSATRLEQAGRIFDIAALRDQTNEFLNNLQVVIYTLEKIKRVKTPKDNLDPHFLRAQLMIIKDACESYNIDAAHSALDEIWQKKCPKRIMHMLSILGDHLLCCELEKAVTLISNYNRQISKKRGGNVIEHIEKNSISC